MSSALVNGVRRVVAQRARSAPARTFKTSAPKRGGGADDPEYLHGPHMYDVGATKGKHFVFGGAALAILGIGGYIPVYAIQFQQRKAGGG